MEPPKRAPGFSLQHGESLSRQDFMKIANKVESSSPSSSSTSAESGRDGNVSVC